eukprot:UN00174
MNDTVPIKWKWLFILIICALVIFAQIVAFIVWIILQKCHVNKQTQSEKEDLEYQKRLNEIKRREDINKHKGILDFKETRPSLKSLPTFTTRRSRESIPGENRKIYKTNVEFESEMKRSSTSNLSDELFQEGEKPVVQQIVREDHAAPTQKDMRLLTDPPKFLV